MQGSTPSTCRAVSPPLLYLSNGPEIRSLSLSRTTQIVRNERRVESIDIYGNLIYWADSYERTIKRSWIPEHNGALIGYGQDLDIKSNGKLTSIKIDYVTGNLYWTETDRSGSKPRGRVGVSTNDGRYRRTIVSGGNLEFPTSIALDPEMGVMFWADAGSIPKIEASWLDGSKRWQVITTAVRYPTGLAIDYTGGHRLYFVDTKLSKIESVKQNGNDRVVILQGDNLRHPISLDVFESWVYWVTRDSGELIKQDKFGRGVPVVVERDLVNPTSVAGELMVWCTFFGVK